MTPPDIRVVALLATYNERRFIGTCVEHLVGQGVDVYLIDNDSTDETVAIARDRGGDGLIGVERFERRGVYSWRPLLQRKADLAVSLEADWFVHLDADEIRLPPSSKTTLARALAEVDAAGYNAVNFQEFTFVPTEEEPDHDHPRFAETMRWYYPFLPRFPHRLNAWKRQPQAVELASGGHEVRFEGLRMYPESFPMRHYLFLSVSHAIEKYVHRVYDPADGMHRARAGIRPEQITLQSATDLRSYASDDRLDPSTPFTRHPLFDSSAPASAVTGSESP